MAVKKIFVICPVRIVDEETNKKIRDYVETQERGGHIVHWPYRDTDQSDKNGFSICATNRNAIFYADEVHIWFNPNSQGSLFDIGMTFAFLMNSKKKVVLINKKEVKPTPDKSFNNIVLKICS